MKRNAYNEIIRNNKKEISAIKIKLKLKKATVCFLGILICGSLFSGGAFALGALMSIIFLILVVAVGNNDSEKLNELEYNLSKHIAFRENITMIYGINSFSDNSCEIVFGESAFKIILSNKRYAFYYNKIKSVVFTSPKGISRLARGGAIGRKRGLSSVARNVKKHLPKWSDSGEYVFVTYLSSFCLKTVVFKIYHPQRSSDYLTDMLPNGVVEHIF